METYQQTAAQIQAHNTPQATHTFRAPDMLAALEKVKGELGPEAIIVSARQATNGPAWMVWRRPGVEVIAMRATSSPVSEENKKPALSAPVKQEMTPPARANHREETPVQTPHKKREIQRTRHDPTDPKLMPNQARAPILFPALEKARRQLLSQGVDEGFVQKAIQACNQSLPLNALEDEWLVRGHLKRQFEAALSTRNVDVVSKNQVLCLIGTSGAGKTSSAAKLAAYYTRTKNRKVAWVSADTIRTGAIAQARAFADSLGIFLHVAYTPDELRHAVDLARNADLILVDTPSCNPRRKEEIVELGSFLTMLPERITYIVLPATAKDADAKRALTAYGLYNPTGLIVTKLDETNSFGSVFNTSWKKGLPLAFFSTGSQVLDDLHPAEASELVSALFGEGLAK